MFQSVLSDGIFPHCLLILVFSVDISFCTSDTSRFYGLVPRSTFSCFAVCLLAPLNTQNSLICRRGKWGERYGVNKQLQIIFIWVINLEVTLGGGGSICAGGEIFRNGILIND